MPPSVPPASPLAQLAAQGAAPVASPQRRVFPGLPVQLAQVRRFVARAMDGCLAVVQNLTACWGHHRYRDGSWLGAVVWFRIDWGAD